MYIVRMPRLGITMETGKVGRWLVELGSPIEAGAAMFEMETDKSTVEIEAQASGVVRMFLVEVDQEVPVNTPLAVIADADEQIDLSEIEAAESDDDNDAPLRVAPVPVPDALAETPTEAAAESADGAGPPVAPVPAAETRGQPVPDAASAGRARLSPFNRKLAQDLGVELDSLAGEEITEERIRAVAVAARGKAATAPSLADPGATAPRTTSPRPAPDLGKDERHSDGDYVELNSIQRAMKSRIASSWTSIAHFVQIVSVDMTSVLKLKGAFGKAGLNDILIKVVGDTAAAHPMINGRLDGDRVRINRSVNVSVAVATPKGLVVPVIRGVEQLGVQDVNAAVAELADKARTSGLGPADTEGGTITFSNLGAYGIEYGTPVINGPQATLVFAGAIVRTVTVGEDEAIRIAPIMRLSIAFDHRFIDGMTAAAFTSDLKKRLETLNPAAFR